MKDLARASIALLILSLVAGCSGSSETPMPRLTSTSQPTAAPVPTAMPEPTDTPTPTQTDTPTEISTATSIPMPTMTQKPTLTPTETPPPLPTNTYTPEPSPTPAFRAYKYEFRVMGHGGDVWIPIPQLSNVQQGIAQISLSQQPTAYYTDPTYQNQVLYYGNAQGVITGVYEFTSALPTRYHIVKENVGEYDTSSHLYQLYTRSETWIETDSPEIVQLAQSIVGDETNPFLAAQKIYDFVRSHFPSQGIPWTGDHAAYRDQYGALATYQRGFGSCQNQALVFVALCRAVGIPARVVHGINPVQTDSEHNIEDFSHSWAEFYLPNYGWIPADPTGNVFGEIDNLRVILSFGNNVVLDPPCSVPDWYCGEGNAMFLVYPFAEMYFKVTAVE